MDKKDLHQYMDRWKLVAAVESKEIKNASFELMMKQTFAIWDIGRLMQFFPEDELPNTLWFQLQIKWKEGLA